MIPKKLVKPLRKQLKTVKTFAGSSIMGDGKVALILDVLGLAQRASLLTESVGQGAPEASLAAKDASIQKQTFLLFTGLGDSRMAIPLDALARLEEFLSSQVEVSGNQWVIQYRGQILPLVRLNLVMDERRRKLRGLRGAAAPEEGALQVLVLNHQGRSFGLVVDHVIDIVEDRADIKAAATRASVLYSTVIGERVTELLDIPAIAASIEGIPLASLASAARSASYGG
jgi:two-component system chemotaxis sensor kinase CheA